MIPGLGRSEVLIIYPETTSLGTKTRENHGIQAIGPLDLVFDETYVDLGIPHAMT